VKYSDGSYGPVREIQTGSGYWSQNGRPVIFKGGTDATIEIFRTNERADKTNRR